MAYQKKIHAVTLSDNPRRLNGRALREGVKYGTASRALCRREVIQGKDRITYYHTPRDVDYAALMDDNRYCVICAAGGY